MRLTCVHNDCFVGVVLEEAQVRCGGADALDRAVAAGRVYMEAGGGANQHDAYYFNKRTRGETNTYQREESMKGSRTTLDATKIKKLSDFFEGVTFVALTDFYTHKFHKAILSHTSFSFCKP